jgi:APA family basic amino acid/polyamine antiporter
MQLAAWHAPSLTGCLATAPLPPHSTGAGELPAFFVLGNTLCYQVLASAAVARSFSAFLAQLAGQPPDFFLVGGGGWNIDCMAFGIALLVTLLVASGVRESALAITGVAAVPVVPAVAVVPAVLAVLAAHDLPACANQAYPAVDMPMARPVRQLVGFHSGCPRRRLNVTMCRCHPYCP